MRRTQGLRRPTGNTVSRSTSSVSEGSAKWPTPRSRRSWRPLLAGAGLLAAGLGLFLSWEEAPTLGGDRWTTVKIKSVTPMTPETSLFRLEVPRSVLPPAFDSDPSARPILSLFVKEPSLQIQRAYTPLSASSFNSRGPAELDLVVKRYPDGELSRYMHRLGPDSELNVRGPSVTWWYRPQDWDEVVFIVGGTGVTPAYQFVNDMLRDSPAPTTTDRPAVSIVYASPSPSRILLKTELDQLAQADPGHVSTRYFVDRLDVAREPAPSDVTVGFLDRGNVEKAIGRRVAGKRRAVVVCGPESMIEAVAGPRGRNFSQGRVGGILQQLGYSDGEVFKL
ncbi:hypothetical protein BMF94_5503 [Rhodotorula taiwanensis]|uniref:NADH-cytochrome b5 reductase n=1 Tax=Rhodotorula taiwanensis TaxID=741276 RepID=A0A2S5B331_9BASI|nr:hypothetical protein BMF94_5503 [Rhodotorula taiwanensis]